ncbi:glycosyltransferase family 9 protein [Halosquirtibacter xylanolyticus]|uniref:glycosyltransferase family 9 protein n=1 Tax=Halosquirtibacter xylanolyticus TaxID=3374599 RepID=UPI003749FCD3|nr:glycosyltransferase family 9 protein [Prolixibacteraceae bacterium]
MKILVIQQKRIGDVLVSTVLCNNLRKAYPDATIDYLVFDFTKEVVIGNPNIDETILFDDADRKGVALLRFALKIRRRHYDYIIDPYSKFDSWVITALSGVKHRISFKNRLGLYTQALPPKTNRLDRSFGEVIANRLNLLTPLLGEDFDFDYIPKIFLKAGEREIGQKILSSYGISVEQPIIMIGVLGSVENKTYPTEYIKTVIDKINKGFEGTILFNYYKNDVEKAKELYYSLERKDNVCWETGGKSLRELAQMLSHVDLYIGNDCGHPHIAKSLSIPTFTFFAPQIDPDLWGILECLPIHNSAHLRDWESDYKTNYKSEELKERNSELYHKMLPEDLYQKIINHLQKNNILNETGLWRDE